MLELRSFLCMDNNDDVGLHGLPLHVQLKATPNFVNVVKEGVVAIFGDFLALQVLLVVGFYSICTLVKNLAMVMNIIFPPNISLVWSYVSPRLLPKCSWASHIVVCTGVHASSPNILHPLQL